jgi:hypothetical protein
LEKMSLNIEKKSEKKNFFSPFFCLSNMNISKKEKFFLFRNIHFFHFFFSEKQIFMTSCGKSVSPRSDPIIRQSHCKVKTKKRKKTSFLLCKNSRKRFHFHFFFS